MLVIHLKNHNNRGRRCTYMSTEKLVKLVADNNPDEAITLFIRNKKMCLDFDYRENAGFGEYIGGFKMCSLCSRDLPTP